MSDMDHTASALTLADAAVSSINAEAAAAASFETFLAAAIAAREAGLRLGASRRTCAAAALIYDALMEGIEGIKASTAAQYLSAIRKMVNDGFRFVSWHEAVNGPAKAKAKAKAKGETSPEEARDKALAALAAFWNNSLSAGMIADWEASYDDDKGSLLSIVADALIKGGYETEGYKALGE